MAEHAFWYTSRAAGIAGYVLLSLSVLWGLALSTGIFQRITRKPAFYEAHRISSLAVLLFIAIHVVSLAGDQFIDWSPARLLVPFTSEYRPLPVAVGIVSAYLVAITTASFYVRRWIGYRAWRSVHYATFVAFLGATVHGIYAGTDSSTSWMRLVYVASVILVVALVDYRLIAGGLRGQRSANRSFEVS